MGQRVHFRLPADGAFPPRDGCCSRETRAWRFAVRSRGANSGVQDAENLAWKLGSWCRRACAGYLLDTYDSERVQAADENILNSTRSTDFITPKNEVSRAFRDATLDLAKDCGFARRLVNSGRLSTPSTYRDSPLNTAGSTHSKARCCPALRPWMRHSDRSRPGMAAG